MKMNKIHFPEHIKKALNSWGLRALIVFMLAISCVDPLIDETFTTFDGETIGDYITDPDNAEMYSEFTKLLERSKVIGLLKAYGKYTCFIPTNEAMYAYYQEHGKSSIEEFDVDSLKKVAYDHIIKDYEVTTPEFTGGFLSYLNMNGRYLRVDLKAVDGQIIYEVNTTAKIGLKDIEKHNGVIHTLNQVLAPTENSLAESIGADDKFSLFYEALLATGLDQRLLKDKDENYDYYSLPSTLLAYDGVEDHTGIYFTVPREKKYGYTAFMESDSTYATHGINNLDDLKAYAAQVYDVTYPEDAGVTDITDSTNSLNRFIAYHLVNKKIPRKYLIEQWDNTGRYTGTTHSIQTVEAGDMCEYIEPMCPNTLIEVRVHRLTGEYDIFNMLDESNAIRLTEDYDNDAKNGVYHEIDDILVFSKDVEQMLATKRLRMDGASFFPEFMNNNIRVGSPYPNSSNKIRAQNFLFPKGYMERLKTGPSTIFGYINSHDRFQDYQGDEIFIDGAVGGGVYEIEITTPPIPAGTYEVRFGWQPTGGRGVAQFYWDGIPTGIPLDMRAANPSTDPKIGWEEIGSNDADPLGYENDKAMRNLGYMKGPACLQVIEEGWYYGIARNSDRALRRILGIFTFDEMTTHKFKAKALIRGEFMCDYFEFVPVEILEYEDIY